MDVSTVTHSNFRLRPPRGFLTLLVVVGSVVLAGCGSDNPTTAPVAANQLYWALHFNWNAVTMALAAPYDTVQLTAAAVNAAGAPLSGNDTVHYKALDSSVTVSPTGLITAHYLTSQSKVAASLTVAGVTLTDTAYIQVTDAPFSAPFASLSIQAQPDGLDSAKIAMDRSWAIYQGNGYIPVYATIATGSVATDTVCDVNNYGCPFLIHWSTSDPTIATVDQYGDLSTIAFGHVTIYASALVYGVGKRDSLPFSVEYPCFEAISVHATGVTRQTLFLSSTPQIGVGCKVTITNYVNESVQVVFPYTTQQISLPYAGAGARYKLTDTLAAVQMANSSQTFKFDSAGSYTLHVTPVGGGQMVDGHIIVSSGP